MSALEEVNLNGPPRPMTPALKRTSTKQRYPQSPAARKPAPAPAAEYERGSPPPGGGAVANSPLAQVSVGANAVPPPGKSLIANSPRATGAPPPPMPVAPVQDAPPLSREELCWQLKRYRGQVIPSGQLGELALAIQTTDSEGPKAPTTVAQRRTFVEDWAKAHADEVSAAVEPPPRQMSAGGPLCPYGECPSGRPA